MVARAKKLRFCCRYLRGPPCNLYFYLFGIRLGPASDTEVTAKRRRRQNVVAARRHLAKGLIATPAG